MPFDEMVFHAWTKLSTQQSHPCLVPRNSPSVTAMSFFRFHCYLQTQRPKASEQVSFRHKCALFVRTVLPDQMRAMFAEETPPETTTEKRLWSLETFLNAVLDPLTQERAARHHELIGSVVETIPMDFLQSREETPT
jgi:hypothetical protein